MDEKTIELPHYMGDEETKLFNSLSEDELVEFGDILCLSLDFELKHNNERNLQHE